MRSAQLPPVFSIVITERGGAQRNLEVDALEAGIGRLEDNEVVLPRSNVSKRHARVVLKDDRCVVIDLKSTNGTYVNGRKISAPVVVGPSDKIYIGDFILTLAHLNGHVTGERRLRSQEPGAAGGPGGAPGVPGAPRRPAPRAPTEPMPELGLDPGLGAPAVSEPLYARPSGGPRQGLSLPVRAPVGGVEPGPGPTVEERLPARPARELEWKSPNVSTIKPPPPAPEESAPRTPAPEPHPAAPVARPSSGPPASLPPTPHRKPVSMPPRVQEHDGAGAATSPAVLSPSLRLQGALSTLMERLGTQMELSAASERAFPSEQQVALEQAIDQLAREGVIGADLDRRFLTQAAISEAVGLGPLDRLLGNRAVREVVVEGPSRVLADLGGGLHAVSSFFSSAEAVRVVGRRLLARAGKSLTDEPVQNALLPDGMQVQILMPPLAPTGPLLSVRCPGRTPVVADGLVTEGMLSLDMLSLLRSAVQRRLNVLVAGPLSSGVSTLIAALGSLCPDHERLVTLLDGPMLMIDHPHVVPLQRSASEEDFAELLRHAARLRPDRILIDDVHGPDALSLLVFASASRGLVAGMHAPSSEAALEQLEMFAQVGLAGSATLGPLLSQAFSLLLHVGTDAEGGRRVMGIAEVRAARGQTLELLPLYRYDQGFKPSEHRAGFLSS